MPTLFLSPSTQEYNQYITGGNEEYYMNLVADAMEPYLQASGITYERNDPNGTVTDSINKSNAGFFDLHLALHSNASPESLSGQLTGIDVYYYAYSAAGRAAAVDIANSLKLVYYNPDKVNIVPTTSLAELNRTIAPAVLVELGYHDNYTDEQWIKENINQIARALSEAVATYFGIPFYTP